MFNGTIRECFCFINEGHQPGDCRLSRPAETRTHCQLQITDSDAKQQKKKKPEKNKTMYYVNL
jgi:hypothetical protein